MSIEADVAIIGGGPAGSTAGTLLKKYGGEGLRVCIFERETFPRDHIGESLLPPISPILQEMGCWDEIEAAGFPIKIGATYRWGKHAERWDVNFIPPEKFDQQPRPAPFSGFRTRTAFQVDRSIYDKVLLDHAFQSGCDVRQACKVTKVRTDADKVVGLELASSEEVQARYYIDASGNSGIMRRALHIGCDMPTTLRNVAIYDYWQNTEWAIEIGVGGTRIQVLSIGYGWIWFIPMGPTRTSIGVVVPADYLKKSGKSASELYSEALNGEPIIAALTKNAKSEGKLQTTRDWSFLADRNTGDNWFLIGESAGFADPILSAGVTMAHIAGRQVAYTILELDRGKLPQDWLRREFEQRQAQRIRTHIRFGDYWYTANEQFEDLLGFTADLARQNGMDLTPSRAWDWIAQGGFIDEDLAVGTGGFSLASVKAMAGVMSDLDAPSPLNRCNVFKLNLGDAKWKDRADYLEGRVRKSPCYVRGDKVLPIDGVIAPVVNLLQRTSDLSKFISLLRSSLEATDPVEISRQEKFGRVLSVLEALAMDGWVTAEYDARQPLIKFDRLDRNVRWNVDPAL